MLCDCDFACSWQPCSSRALTGCWLAYPTKLSQNDAADVLRDLLPEFPDETGQFLPELEDATESEDDGESDHAPQASLCLCV